MDNIYSESFNCESIDVKYKCQYCDFTTDLRLSLNHHIWRCHKSFHDYSKIDTSTTTYTCKKCNNFTSCSILVWHAHNRKCCVFKKKSISSNISNGPSRQRLRFSPTDKNNDIVELFYIDPERFFCCKLCKYKSRCGHTFQLHLLKHQTFKCNLCDFMTRRKFNLDRHMSLMHRFDIKHIFRCDQCEYTTSRIPNFTKHRRRHDGCGEKLKLFKCNECEFETYQQQYLKRHIIRKHSQTSKYQCSQCLFKTAYRYYLKKHIIIFHTDDKEIKWFECDLCDYKAKVKHILDYHINTKHNGLVHWKCRKCSYKSFVDQLAPYSCGCMS